MCENTPLPVLVQEAFVAGTQAAMQELYQLDGVVVSDAVQPYLSEDQTLVVASIPLQREPAGILTVTAPLDVARRLAERYLPAGAEVSNELVDDCLAELANVIAGQGKTALKGTPYHFMLGLPTVARQNNPTSVAQAWRCLVSSEAGNVTMTVYLPGTS